MRYPSATWLGPVDNRYPGGMNDHRGLILHVMEGTMAGTDAWFHNDKSQASAHFGNPKSGPLVQWVDTDDAAWAEAAGNRLWISIEHEGHAGDELTSSQLENDAQLYAWLTQQYGVPLAQTDTPNGRGLGWHGMGGDAWGGHYDCPGDPIKNARTAILDRAAAILHPPAPTTAPTPKDDDMPTILTGKASNGTGVNIAVFGPLAINVASPKTLQNITAEGDAPTVTLADPHEVDQALHQVAALNAATS